MIEASVVPMGVYLVADIGCDHCKATIESALSRLAGLERVEVSVDTKRVMVIGTAPDDVIRAAIEDAGYDVTP